LSMVHLRERVAERAQKKGGAGAAVFLCGDFNGFPGEWQCYWQRWWIFATMTAAITLFVSVVSLQFIFFFRRRSRRSGFPQSRRIFQRVQPHARISRPIFTAHQTSLSPARCSYHPPLCMESLVDGPPFTRHCDWFHMGGCLDAILYAPSMNASAHAQAAAAAPSSSSLRPLCTAAWLPFDHPCLRPVPAPPPSAFDTGVPRSSPPPSVSPSLNRLRPLFPFPAADRCLPDVE
jgi:hypothetical protein